MNDLQNTNQALWEEWSRLHIQPGSDYLAQIERFQAGECVIDECEVREVGDVSGKALLHLMCHLGLGTLSWARLGARATGLDFSQEALRIAREFNQEAGLEARFVYADVYAAPDILNEKFDIVYTSGGVMTWLADINAWARVVATCLKPGGFFYLKDSHPFRRVMFPLVVDGNGNTGKYQYFSDQPTRLEMRGSYAQPNSDRIQPAYFWVHGIGEIVTSLCQAGLRIEFLHEFPKVYPNFATYTPNENGRFELRGVHDWAVPNQFSLRATLD
jgi:SAM-dependent methyltransferase